MSNDLSLNRMVATSTFRGKVFPKVKPEEKQYSSTPKNVGLNCTSVNKPLASFPSWKGTFLSVSKISQQNNNPDKSVEKDLNLDKDTLKLIENLDDIHKKDFYNVCLSLKKKHPNILTPENTLVLAKIVPASLKSDQYLLSHALKVENGEWLALILQNPYFSKEDKIDAIKPNCKVFDGKNIIKNENLFLNATTKGDVPSYLNDAVLEGSESLGLLTEGSESLGLFTNDTQFLNNYRISVFDKNKATPLELKLLNSKNFNYGANYCLESKNKDLNISRKQLINKGFFEEIIAHNKSNEEKVLKLDLKSQIEDIFEVRGKRHKQQRMLSQSMSGNDIILNTLIDNNKLLGLKVLIKIDGKPVQITDNNNLKVKKDNSLYAQVKLPPNSSKRVEVSLQPIISQSNTVNKPFVNGKIVEDNQVPANYNQALTSLSSSTIKPQEKIHLLGNGIFEKEANEIIQRSFDDINLVKNKLSVNEKDYEYVGAGLPYYSCLFGRDSVITSMFLLPLQPNLAKDTLNLLAEYQGKSLEERWKEELIKNPEADRNNFEKYYKEKEEAEGKILHELRVGELAAQNKIPHTPYYGGVDATSLWLMLVSDYYKWTGDKETIIKLMPKIDKALNWIDENSKDNNPKLNGFLKFKKCPGTSVTALTNQGWKDSENSAKHYIGPDGKLKNPEYPIALAEVQGYTYAAKKGISKLYKDLGLVQKAEKIDTQAEELKTKFNEEFWLNDLNFITMALDAQGNPLSSITSSAGQALATGIVSKDKTENINNRITSKAALIEEITMSDELNSGWGIRTLSKASPAYDPKSYHNGSVWPHDTAFIAQGISGNNAAKLTKNLIEAVSASPNKRIYEALSGFDRKPFNNKVDVYPNTCSPQAWSSSGIINMLVTCMKIEPDIKENALILNNPMLPEGLSKMKIEGLKFKNQSLTLHVSRLENNQLKISAHDPDGKELQVQKSKNSNIYKIK